MARPLKVGAVMYDPKVSVIWEIIRDFFDAQGAPIDVAFYSTYEDQNDGLLSGAIDIAWNSPLAWVDAQRRSGNGCRAIAMRDTDRDRIVLRRGAAQRSGADARRPEGPHDCHRRDRLAAGHAHPARPPAPRGARAPEWTSTVRRFDVLVGKHGDHVGGERDALACLTQGDAAAVRDARPELGGLDQGRHDRRRTSSAIVGETDRFDHCVFTVREALDPVGREGVARRALRHALRQSRAPRDDGPRRPEGLAARTDDGLRPADGSGRVGAVLRASLVVSLPLFPVTTVGSWPRPPEVAEAMRAYRRAPDRPRGIRSHRRRGGGAICCGCRRRSAATS